MLQGEKRENLLIIIIPELYIIRKKIFNDLINSKLMIFTNFKMLLLNNQFGTSVTFPSIVFSTEYLIACSISEKFKALKSFVLRSVFNK